MPKRCSRCVMPETPGHIELGETGVCNLCAKHNAEAGTALAPSGEKLAGLMRRVDSLRETSTGPYNALAALSGGKDSTMALHIAVKTLGLTPLAVFIDNGFCVEAMYRNVKNATDSLGVDLLIFKPQLIKHLFRHLLTSKSRVYFCRICNALIDYYIRAIAVQHGITLLISGHTKGQEFVKSRELFWIYRASDEALLQAIKGCSEFSIVAEIFSSLTMYFHRTFGSLTLLSPFQYLTYAESQILSTITNELGYALPDISWPRGSTNCLFNFVCQKLTVDWFGYSQHEAEISTMVRTGEMTRRRALEIIETPISETDLQAALDRIGMPASDIDSLCSQSR
jgi:hypothetical protein